MGGTHPSSVHGDSIVYLPPSAGPAALLLPQSVQQAQGMVWTSLYRERCCRPGVATHWLRARGKDSERHTVPALPPPWGRAGARTQRCASLCRLQAPQHRAPQMSSTSLPPVEGSSVTPWPQAAGAAAAVGQAGLVWQVCALLLAGAAPLLFLPPISLWLRLGSWTWPVPSPAAHTPVLPLVLWSSSHAISQDPGSPPLLHKQCPKDLAVASM